MNVLFAVNNYVRAQLASKQLTFGNHLNLYEENHLNLYEVIA